MSFETGDIVKHKDLGIIMTLFVNEQRMRGRYENEGPSAFLKKFNYITVTADDIELVCKEKDAGHLCHGRDHVGCGKLATHHNGSSRHHFYCDDCADGDLLGQEKFK
jgi:hypothetical protein